MEKVEMSKKYSALVQVRKEILKCLDLPYHLFIHKCNEILIPYQLFLNVESFLKEKNNTVFCFVASAMIKDMTNEYVNVFSGCAVRTSKNMNTKKLQKLQKEAILNAIGL